MDFLHQCIFDAILQSAAASEKLKQGVLSVDKKPLICKISSLQTRRIAPSQPYATVLQG